ncbi:Single-stranded DNA-binding protein (fragment) [Desulfamplus magnetovallimortis]|uniref:Single-stranded DNA-binding protein n=1 Tax=Desulfamplus magnetovallimortis TaxID=1246637 RepID=A0A1W1HEB8_9BACT
MNICIITGHLGADPESTYTQNETLVVTFSIAFKSTKDKTSWIKTVCFKKTAELAERYLHKGAKVAVTGLLDQDKWTTEHGENRTMIKLIANNLEFLKTDGRGFQNETSSDNEPNTNELNSNEDDDIPF